MKQDNKESINISHNVNLEPLNAFYIVLKVGQTVSKWGDLLLILDLDGRYWRYLVKCKTLISVNFCNEKVYRGRKLALWMKHSFNISILL